MIFVTVGNATQGFPRLLRGVDDLVRVGAITEHVLMQTGRSPGYSPRSAAHVPLMTPAEFEKAVASAAVVVCHAGAGTLLQVLAARKHPVVVPRLRAFGEHVDDHQSELATELAARGRITVVWRIEDLGVALDTVKAGGFAPSRHLGSDRIASLVARALRELTRQS